MKISFWDISYLNKYIRSCQKKKHIQQVAFSTYHHALTQICFTCDKCRTSIKEIEIEDSKIGEGK